MRNIHLRSAILAKLATQGELHAYGLYKTISGATLEKLYPTLHSMARKGLLASRTERAAHKLCAGRRYYRLTDKGTAQLPVAGLAAPEGWYDKVPLLQGLA